MARYHIIIENKIIQINETQRVVSGELNRNPTKFKSLYKSFAFSRVWICLRHLGLYKDKYKM